MLKHLVLCAILAAVLVTGSFNGVVVGQSLRCNVLDWQGDERITDFLDTVELSLSTPRNSLALVVMELQARHRAFERTEHPECLGDTPQAVTEGMELYVSSMLMFLGDDSGALRELGAANRVMSAAADELLDLIPSVDERMTEGFDPFD